MTRWPRTASECKGRQLRPALILACAAAMCACSHEIPPPPSPQDGVILIHVGGAFEHDGKDIHVEIYAAGGPTVDPDTALCCSVQPLVSEGGMDVLFDEPFPAGEQYDLVCYIDVNNDGVRSGGDYVARPVRVLVAGDLWVPIEYPADFVHEPFTLMTGVVSAAAGGYHSHVVKTDGTLWDMGANYDGQLGLGDEVDRVLPEQVMTGVVSVAAGQSHSIAVATDGTAWAMGYNWSGQLGDGTTSDGRTPVAVVD